MEKYRIAIMGASGAGRTVFLCSYFKMAFSAAVKRKQQRRPISVKSQDVGIIDKFITFLFKQPNPVPWIIARHMDLSLYEDSPDTDFSFCVDSLNMDITLFDVPRDYCYQDMDRWTETDFVPDLRTADGVLFFLSGEDLIHHPEKLLKDNIVFTRAISFIRENQGRKWEGRQDVPITFIFTKGDTIPDVDVKTLQAKIASLFQAACQDREDAGLLLKRLFKKGLFQKGKHVQCFKTTAMGKWPDPQTPPLDYEPKNVVEPMEKLYEAMRKTKTEYRYKRLKVAASIAALCFLVFLGGCWSFDFWRWNRTLKDYERSFERKEYRKALKVLDEFADRYVFPEPLPLYPDFLRPGRRTEALRQSAYQQYEGELYAEIEPFLKDAELFSSEEASKDVVPFPAGTAEGARAFLEATERARTYLGCQEFRESQPERYERVRNAKGFFTDVDAVALVMVQAEVSVAGKAVPEVEGAAGGGLFVSAMACLESLKVLGPRLSAEDTQNINDGLRTVLQAWGQSLPKNSKIEELERRLTQSAQMLGLSSPTPLSAENRKKLQAVEQNWKTLWETLWSGRTGVWLNEMGRLPPDKIKEELTVRLSRYKMPDSSRRQLADVVADLYIETCKEDAYALANAQLACRDLGMSDKKSAEFDERIRKAHNESLNEVLESFKAVNDIEPLKEALEKARGLPDFPQKKEMISNQFQAKFKEVVRRYCGAVGDDPDFKESLEKKDFENALRRRNNLIQGLEEQLLSLVILARGGSLEEVKRDIRREVYAFFSDGENSLMDRHYKFCRETARRENLTTWDRLDKALPVLDAFLSSWAFEAENGAEKSEALKEASKRSLEVRRAKEFLEELKDKKEIYGTLTVVRASIDSGMDFWSKPDGKVYISHGETSFSTSCIDDTYEPYFDRSETVRLNLRNPVFVELRDIDDDSSSELIFNKNIDINSPFGYMRLSDTHGRRDTVTLRFTPHTPYPW